MDRPTRVRPYGCAAAAARRSHARQQRLRKYSRGCRQRQWREATLHHCSRATLPRRGGRLALGSWSRCLVALVNGLARRTLSCAAPVLERDGLFTKAELEGVYMGGYQSFALGRAFAAPIISRLGSKRALLLQLATLSLSSTGFCASAGRPALQAANPNPNPNPNRRCRRRAEHRSGVRVGPSPDPHPGPGPSSCPHPCPSLSFQLCPLHPQPSPQAGVLHP